VTFAGTPITEFGNALASLSKVPASITQIPLEHRLILEERGVLGLEATRQYLNFWAPSAARSITYGAALRA
jgi:hypothetical protein